MIDKKKAEKTEAKLLDIFDYAWNKCGNGSCRRDEILSKLDSKSTSQISTVLRKLQLWKHPAFGRKAGISIDASVPLDEENSFLLPQVFKFGKSQLHFVYGNKRFYEDHKICGVAVGNGSVCKNMPPLGRKRCEEHKGKKIMGTGSIKDSSTACGLVLEDGSLCSQLPSYGRKLCEAHNGRRIYKLESNDIPHIGQDIFDQKETQSLKCHQLPEGVKHGEDNSICGVVYGDGTVCIRKPVSGRKRCEEHKGRKIRVLLQKMSMEGLDKKKNPSICGVSLVDGSRCMKSPIPGRKRCQSHKGWRINS